MAESAHRTAAEEATQVGGLVLSKGTLAAFSALTQPLWVFELDAYRMVWANPAALRFWAATSLEELTSRDFVADMSEATRLRLARYRDCLARGESLSERWTFYPNAASPQSADCACSAVSLPDGALGMLVEARSVAEADAATHRAATAIAHTSIMISLFDEEGELLFQNEAAAKVFGVGKAGELRRRFEDELEGLRAFELVVAGKTFKTETAVACLGQSAWHRVYGQRTHDPISGHPAFLFTHIDLVDQPPTDQQLGDSEARHRALLEALPDLVFSFSPGGICVSCHPEALVTAHTGVPNPIGCSIERIFEQSFARQLKGAIADVLAGREVAHFEGSIRSTDEARSFEVRVAGGGELAVAVFRDVTETQRLHQRLSVCDHLASVGALAAGVAHEINNPLSYVSMNLEMIGEELEALGVQTSEAMDAPSELSTMLAEARGGVGRVRNIVRQLMTFAAVDNARSSLVEVASVVDAALKLASNDLRHRARVVRDFGPAPRVRVVESRLGQVVLNLLTNAANAMPLGSAQENEIRLRTFSAPDGAVVIEVGDTGMGIDPAMLPHIFDPFYSSQQPGSSGMGLGLCICANIVREMGGRITVASQEGVGSVFRVRLPAADGEPRSTAPVPARQAPCVVVIDDDVLITRSVVKVLKSYETQAFNSGPEALGYLLDPQSHCELVLCDLMMPEMSGAELLERLGKSRPELLSRFVFMTGGALSSTPELLAALGDYPLLLKPFDIEQVRTLVAERLQALSAAQGGH